MKNKTPPTGVERRLDKDAYIVSKTDTKGKITYANRSFMQLSGYSEKDLLGVQHNILRHPQMPRGVFKLLWDTISAGDECFAYVINLCKNGDHYWVFANISPTTNQRGKIDGYYSVRRLPSPDVVKTVSELYKKMLVEESRAGVRGAVKASQSLLNDVIKGAGHDSYETFILSL